MLSCTPNAWYTAFLKSFVRYECGSCSFGVLSPSSSLQVSPEDIRRDQAGESSGPPPFIPFEKTAASKILSKPTSSSSRKLPSWDGDGSGSVERVGSTGKSTVQHRSTVATAKTSHPPPSMEKGERDQEKSKISQSLPRMARGQEKATKDGEDRRKKTSWGAREELFSGEASRPISGKQFNPSRNDKREDYTTAGYSNTSTGYPASRKEFEYQDTGKRSSYHVASDQRHQKRPYEREGGRHVRQPKPYSGGHVPSEVSDGDQPSGHSQQGRRSVQQQRGKPDTYVVQGDPYERERGRDGSEKRGGGRKGRHSGQSEHRSGRVELSDWMEMRTEREEQRNVMAAGGRTGGHSSQRRGQHPAKMRELVDRHEQQQNGPPLSSGRRAGQEYYWDTVVSGHSSVPFSAKRSAAQ